MLGCKVDAEFGRTDFVKVLLDMLGCNEFVDNFHDTELDVSLLEKLKSTLLKVQAIVNMLR